MADLEGSRFEPPELEEWVVPAAHYHYISTCFDNDLINFSVENYQHVNVISLYDHEISGNSDGCILYFNHSHLIFANSNQSFFLDPKASVSQSSHFWIVHPSSELSSVWSNHLLPNNDQQSFFFYVFFLMFERDCAG